MSNVILDVDTGEDDALAIILAANMQLDVRLVVSSYGNSTIENTTRNTRAVVALAGLTTCPVFKGAAKPSQQHPHFVGSSCEWESAAEMLGGDGLCGVELTPPDSVPLFAPPECERVERLAELIRLHAPVRYIVTGPCTNLSELCEYFGSKIHDYISSASIMGGALEVPGNSGPRDSRSGKQRAEFNFYCDPFAVNVVLRSGLPIYMVPWDTTYRLTIPASRVHSLRTHDERTRFITGLMRRFFDLYGLKLDREFEFNDPAAVWLPVFAPGQFKERLVQAVTTADGFGGLVEHTNGAPVLFHSCESEWIDTIINELLARLELV